ncbi:zinc finger C3HC4-type RING finger family protein [Striga asiatica]|uniref:Zinc finger C3HC4-type RING finger family protein n=1 Tax=Striga asiatica TaxID=4170 RepID=A0A5A7QJE4_STRAF|nr:zinc finger C3HC4-type RING finger family protein [Striga asiatica]
MSISSGSYDEEQVDEVLRGNTTGQMRLPLARESPVIDVVIEQSTSCLSGFWRRPHRYWSSPTLFKWSTSLSQQRYFALRRVVAGGGLILCSCRTLLGISGSIRQTCSVGEARKVEFILRSKKKAKDDMDRVVTIAQMQSFIDLEPKDLDIQMIDFSPNTNQPLRRRRLDRGKRYKSGSNPKIPNVNFWPPHVVDSSTVPLMSWDPLAEQVAQSLTVAEKIQHTAGILVRRIANDLVQLRIEHEVCKGKINSLKEKVKWEKLRTQRRRDGG